MYRLAVSSDAPELYKLNCLFNGVGLNSLDSIEASITDNSQEIVFVVDTGSKLVGFCCGQVFKSFCYSETYAEITELYILDEYRKQGIGKRLLEITEMNLCQRGVKHFHILTGNDNIAAQRLYFSNGYKKTSEVLLDKN